jgi:hypothetical protein
MGITCPARIVPNPIEAGDGDHPRARVLRAASL